jgi:hypothetical protein
MNLSTKEIGQPEQVTNNELKDENQQVSTSIALVVCSFTVEELKLISYALTHLHSTNADYLTWKKDEFSQKEIPKEMGKILKLYHKIPHF